MMNKITEKNTIVNEIPFTTEPEPAESVPKKPEPEEKTQPKSPKPEIEPVPLKSLPEGNEPDTKKVVMENIKK